jgi:hypothetical protein
MIAAVVVALLAALTAAVVLAPLFKPGALEAERVAARVSAEEDARSRHAMAVAALRDLEEDRQTGKIGDADYATLKASLEARAVTLMKTLDAHAAERR